MAPLASYFVLALGALAAAGMFSVRLVLQQ